MLASSAGPVFFTGPTPALKAVLLLPLLSLGATMGLGAALARAQWRGTGAASARAGLLLVVAASGAYAAVLHTWNLLGWQF